jgi:hypothetical protein
VSHALFSPSSAKRWLNCPGSVALGLLHPEPPEGPYAAEGTRLHDVAASILHRKAGRPSVSDADWVAVGPYIHYVNHRIVKADAWAVEETIHHSGLLFGTPDLMMMFKADDLLEVVDLKTGAGIMVDPVENDQALAYAYMVVSKLIKDQIPPPHNIRLTIVQPPDEDQPVKCWDTTLGHVLAWGAEAESAIATALAGGAPLQPGDHCRFCKAKPTCPALRGEVVEALGGTMPIQMTPGSLAQWLDRADRMEGFIKAVRETGHAIATKAAEIGAPGIPGWVLKPKRATRQWADEEAVLAIARKRKIKIWQDKLMSPAMAEKAHPNMPQELTEQIIAVSSGSNLVRGETPAQVTTAKPSLGNALRNLIHRV